MDYCSIALLKNLWYRRGRMLLPKCPTRWTNNWAGDLGYTVPAEFIYPNTSIKRSFICCTYRRRSAGIRKGIFEASQFILLQVRFIENELKQMEMQLKPETNPYLPACKRRTNPKIMELYRSGDKAELAILRDTLIGKTELEAEKRKDEANWHRNSVGHILLLAAFLSWITNTVYGEVTEAWTWLTSRRLNEQIRPPGRKYRY